MKARATQAAAFGASLFSMGACGVVAVADPAPTPQPPAPTAQPALGFGIVPHYGTSTSLAPFAELRLRLEDRPSRGFNEKPTGATGDPSDLLVRFRPGVVWKSGRQMILVQGQGALAQPLQNTSSAVDQHLEFHQLFYNALVTPKKNLDVRLGRQELSYGEERLIGAFNWANTGRTFDGARVVFGQSGINSLDGFVSRTVKFVNTPQPQFFFSGLYGTRTSKSLGTLDLYVLSKDNDGGALLDRYTFGGRWKKQFSPIWGISGEAAGQTGRDKTASQAGAWAGHVALTQNLSSAGIGPRRVNLTLLEEANAASGTGSPTSDGGTFDNLFPTNHDKYGYMDYQSWKNMNELRLGASMQPAKSWTLTGDWHQLGLASAHDFWYAANGSPMLPKQNRTIDYGTDVGQELDFTAAFKASRHAAYYGGVSTFLPGSFVQRVQGRQEPSTWLFLQTTLTY